MVIYGYIWLYMVIYGYIWLYMVNIYYGSTPNTGNMLMDMDGISSMKHLDSTIKNWKVVCP